MPSFKPAQPNTGHPRRPALAALLLITALLPGPAPAAAAESVEELVDGLEALRRELQVPAFALVLVDRERVLFSDARGIADLASARPADDATLFRIGSVTKMFTAVAVLMAVQDGSLTLDAPLRDIVPDPPLQNPYAGTHPLRIAHLLEHTSGLPDLSREEFDATEPLPLRAALAWKAADRRVLWPPGDHYSYSNVNAGLAALALETATGRDFETFVSERIFRPLGMTSAGFTPDPSTLARLATGYDADGITPIPYWHMLYRAFGAINVRPAELAPFIRMLLNRGMHDGVRLLDAELVRRMETPRTSLAARSGLEHGYGLGSYRWYHRGTLFHGHGGDADGYLSRLGYSRDTGMGYFLAINVFRRRDLERLRRRVEDFIATAPRTPAPVAVLPERLQQLYAGEYEAVTRRFPGSPPRRLRMRAHEGGLILEEDGRSVELVPVNDRHFRRRHEPEATSAVIVQDGSVCYQDDDGSYRKIGPEHP